MVKGGIFMNPNETNWHFITNHGLVLSYIANNPSHTAREISMEVNITERTTHKIIKDLESAGYINKEKLEIKIPSVFWLLQRLSQTIFLCLMLKIFSR